MDHYHGLGNREFGKQVSATEREMLLKMQNRQAQAYMVHLNIDDAAPISTSLIAEDALDAAASITKALRQNAGDHKPRRIAMTVEAA